MPPLLYAVALLGGLFVSVRAIVRTPDRDRRLAYPDEPALWYGADGEPARPGLALISSQLFWACFAVAAGGCGQILYLVGRAEHGWTLPLGLAIGLTAALAFAVTQLRHGPGLMHQMPERIRSRRPATQLEPRVLFICGSLNQTTQMHAIARALTRYLAVEAYFTPHYSDHGAFVLLRKLGALETTIAGYKLRARCLTYLREQGLPVDLHGERFAYDLVVTCSDQVLPRHVRDTPKVLVQEGILTPTHPLLVWLRRRLPFVPRFVAGTVSTGQSLAYERFCVASEGYREHFVRQGLPPHKIVVTGIPNFDDLKRHLHNDFPQRDYVLLCTSDSRETLGAPDKRSELLRRAVTIAGDRHLIVKLHPNEDFRRATAEVARHAPQAQVFTAGSAEDMIGNCAVLITEWSSVSFVGVALGKEVHSYCDLDEIRRLMPLQHGRAAEQIADVCRELLRTGVRAEGRRMAFVSAAAAAVSPRLEEDTCDFTPRPSC